MATQNPIESEGTYPLPEAQLDRFLMKILVDYPSAGRGGGRRRAQPRRRPAEVREMPVARRPAPPRGGGARRCSSTARRSATPSRWPTPPGTPATTASATSRALIEFGASPRGPIGLVQAARALALLRGRGHVVPADIRDLAADVLRHRIVLSYDALSEGVTADELLERILAAVPEPERGRLTRPPAAVAAPVAGRLRGREHRVLAPPAAPPGSRPDAAGR